MQKTIVFFFCKKKSVAILADATIYSLIEKYEKLSEIFTNFPVISGAIEYYERQNRSALVSHFH